MKPVTMAKLEAGLDAIRQSPTDAGALALIVRRPQVEAQRSFGSWNARLGRRTRGRQLESPRQFSNRRWVGPSQTCNSTS